MGYSTEEKILIGLCIFLAIVAVVIVRKIVLTIRDGKRETLSGGIPGDGVIINGEGTDKETGGKGPGLINTCPGKKGSEKECEEDTTVVIKEPLIDDGERSPKEPEKPGNIGDINPKSDQRINGVHIYGYESDKKVWICRYCDCENSQDTDICVICGKKR